MTLASEVKREYPMKALFDSFVAGKRLSVDEVREALNPSADFKAQLDQAMELVLLLVAANQRLREEQEICDECGHAIKAHGKYGCEYERGDAYVTGNQPSAPTILMAQGPCGCREVLR